MLVGGLWCVVGSCWVCVCCGAGPVGSGLGLRAVESQLHKRADAQMHKRRCTDAQTQMHRCTDADAQMHRCRCTDAQMHGSCAKARRQALALPEV
eukprot:530616-Rhodomonas_salina.3